MSDFGEILVTPEYLKQRAQAMGALLNKALDGYERIEEITGETAGCFVGKSADRMKKRMESKKEKGTGQIRVLIALSEKLNQIAEEYAAAERENEDAANRN